MTDESPPLAGEPKHAQLQEQVKEQVQEEQLDDRADPSGRVLTVATPPGPTSVSAAARAWSNATRELPALMVRKVSSGTARVVARLFDIGARGGAVPAGTEESAALSRVGGPIARWISFPRGVRTTTAATSGVALGLGAWGMLVLAGAHFTPGTAAIAAGLGLASSAGPLGVRMADRLHRLIALRRRFRISELRGVPDRRAVAVRGVVMAIRTAASPLDHRALVWSLTRFRRRRPPFVRAFFHEVAFDFMLADGTDEPIWVEVKGGMLIDRFGPDQRVQFQSTTLLEIDHPFLTGLRIHGQEVRSAEIAIAGGDVVEVVGRLSRRLDPSAPSDSGREPPQRRVLRSGTRVPVMIRRIAEPDLELARVRRLSPRRTPDINPGEPPVRKF